MNWWNCKILLYIIKIAMTKTGKGLKYILVMMLVQQGFFSDYITPARRQPPLTSDYLYEEKRQRRPILRLDTSSTSSSFFILDKRRKGQCSSDVGFVCRAVLGLAFPVGWLPAWQWPAADGRSSWQPLVLVLLPTAAGMPI